MSNYFLCAHCDNCVELHELDRAVCCKRWHLNAKIMFDHHGKDGKRYDEPRDVCIDFEPRRDKR